MVFMIKISISKEDYIPSNEEFGHILASVIIFPLTQFNTTNCFSMKSSVLTDIDKMIFQRQMRHFNNFNILFLLNNNIFLW